MLRTALSVLMAQRNERQDEISKVTGISKATLSNIANNKTSGIQYENLEALAIYFNVSIGELFEFSPYKITPHLSVNGPLTINKPYNESQYEELNSFKNENFESYLNSESFFIYGSTIEIVKPNFKVITEDLNVFVCWNENTGESDINVYSYSNELDKAFATLPVGFKKSVIRELSDFVEENYKTVLNDANAHGDINIQIGLMIESVKKM